jgi:glutamate formiminotransferase/formiminotetrahydrofolate cyclodeaminase
MKLVECVPNFSEGRDKAKIEAITSQVETVQGARLLDVDPGWETNRTVVTFIGTPEAIVEAAFRCIKKAYEVIDMSKHTGAHARQGACDVCPFVPVTGVSMDDCVEISHKLAKKVADELNLPVYMYEYAATKPEWTKLPDIRVGEYEALSEKMKDPYWKPDYGPQEFNPKFGVLTTGARKFLIAYNINLNTVDEKKAKRISRIIREKGQPKRDKKGKIVKDENGETVFEPGLFKNCAATGWYISDYGCAQITMNLTDYEVTPPHVVFDKCCELAFEMGIRVTGSELVGLIPKKAMLEAGEYFLRKQKRSRGVPEKELIRIAVMSMSLDQLYPFEPDKKIIEYFVESDEGKLRGMTLREFADELSTDSPAPGGGSVAALAGCMSGALSSMVANLTWPKKEYKEHRQEMLKLPVAAQKLKDFFLYAIDRDTEAFNRVMDCFRLPKDTKEEKKAREKAIEDATKGAIDVPFEVLKGTLEALDLAAAVVERGNRNSISDAGVAGIMAKACAEGAYYNVVINLPGISDKEYVKKAYAEAKKVLAAVREKAEKIAVKVEGALGKDLED